MAEYEGVSRIFRTGSDVRPDKHKVVSRTDEEKRRREEAETKDEPQDTVELHAEDDAPVHEDAESDPKHDEPEDEEGFDISA